MTTEILQSYINKWLEAHPAQQLSLPFLDPARHDLLLAAAALEQQLVNAAYSISEPTVSEVKLKWWAEELTGAPVSGGRHPLVKELFAAPAIKAIPAATWIAPVLAAIEQLTAATAPDFKTQVARATRFHGALATLETIIWFGPEADATRAGRVAALDHLLYGLTRLREHAGEESIPMPMAHLARFGLDRESLAVDSEKRRDAIRAQLKALASEWQAAMKSPGPLSLFRGLDARLGLAWVRQTRHARKPLVKLRHVQEHQTGLRTLRHAWAAGRASVRAR